MKPLAWGILLGLLTAALVLPLSEMRAAAEAKQNSAPQQPAPPQPDQGGVSISVEVPIVSVDVVATTERGDLLTGLKKENFRILEDGVPQTIGSFAPTDAPITIVIVMEFSRVGYGYFSAYAKYWTSDFFRNLKKDDWVALVTFDMNPRLEADFTQNKEEVEQTLMRLYFPGFSESNVFDAVLDTLNKLKDVKGKKSILVVASGIDTFSKHTLDQTLKQLRQTDVTIFCVGVAKPLMNRLEARGGSGGLNFYQAENQLRTFAQMTGGNAWFPQFDGEIPGIFRDVAAFLRNQYSIAYSPANRARDGKFRKIKVELVAPDGSPLIVQDQKGKKQKYVVFARQGYVAPTGSVGD
jgi:VWFA-related protein